MKSKHFFILAISLCLSALIILALLTVYIDPFFHFHAPIDGVSYQLSNQRYQNDGILRHFEYDAIIIGTSMTQNFKTSEMDAHFGTNSVKVPLVGAYNKEIGDRLNRAFESENEITHVVMSLDLFSLLADKDAVSYDDYPEYLYDDNIFNDVHYLFNKTVLVDHTILAIRCTLSGQPMTSFDDYSKWSDTCTYGKEAALALYERPAQVTTATKLTEERRQSVIDSLEQNIISLARENKETTFYCFIPPYSILRLDSWLRSGSFDCYFDIYKAVSEALLAEENIRVFSFYEENDIICNLDNYRDDFHFGGWINSHILKAMAKGEHELTSEGIEDYFEITKEYYRSYDYDSIFEE